MAGGNGESDVTVHAGSYHLALRACGVEQANILTYSSILPPEAVEVPHRKVHHGAVVESITAVAHCGQGQTAQAGLVYGWLHDPLTGQRAGGLVCEYNGPEREDVTTHLATMLDELHQNGYEYLELRGPHFVTNTVTPTKRYGTAIVGLFFVSHLQELV